MLRCRRGRDQDGRRLQSGRCSTSTLAVTSRGSRHNKKIVMVERQEVVALMHGPFELDRRTDGGAATPPTVTRRSAALARTNTMALVKAC